MKLFLSFWGRKTKISQRSPYQSHQHTSWNRHTYMPYMYINISFQDVERISSLSAKEVHPSFGLSTNCPMTVQYYWIFLIAASIISTSRKENHFLFGGCYPSVLIKYRVSRTLIITHLSACPIYLSGDYQTVVKAEMSLHPVSSDLQVSVWVGQEALYQNCCHLQVS